LEENLSLSKGDKDTLFLSNHLPNLNLVNDGGTVGMKEAPTS